MLDQEILGNYQAIAQQTTCVYCYPAGLAEAIAEALPYGCPYKQRRAQPPEKKFSVVADCSEPGTINVYRPSSALYTKALDGSSSPIVINMFAQWELGLALKYKRVPCPAEHGSDSVENREE